MLTLRINGETHELTVDPGTPLLWVLRETLKLTGTKFGCGVGLCGACTVQVNGAAMRSCSLPVSAAQGKEIKTIEGLAPAGDLHPIQQTWIAEQVPQCGYCQSGQIMAAAALLQEVPNPDDAAIDKAMSGIICRCGMYGRIRRAIKRAANGDVAEYDPKEAEHG